jgi:hypothetical protein
MDRRTRTSSWWQRRAASWARALSVLALASVGLVPLVALHLSPAGATSPAVQDVSGTSQLDSVACPSAASAGTGTLPATTTGTRSLATTVNSVTGGTGRFAGASGQITIYASISASTVGSTETLTTVGFWVGSISYPAP